MRRVPVFVVRAARPTLPPGLPTRSMKISFGDAHALTPNDSKAFFFALGWVGLGWVGLGWVGLGWVGLG